MKVDKKTFEQMKKDLWVLINYVGVKKVQQMYCRQPIGTAFKLWMRLYDCKVYDEHPHILWKSDGSRLFPKDSEFNLYPCKTNDTTLQTALVKALDEILCPKHN